MPTLVELFKTKTINDGPNAGKTAETAYAVQNSKDLPVVVENPLLQPLIEKINKRRQTSSIRIGENRLEQETVGLRAFTDTSKLVLYGGDYFRIINGNTRSKQIMFKNANLSGAGLGDSITDKIGTAVGNLVGDSVQNIFLKKDDRVRPKLDTRSLGIDIGADLLSRTVGRILPDPLIPSKVIELTSKAKSKNEELYIHEYDIDKRNKDLLTRKTKGLDKLLQGLLKEGTDSMGQTKDFLISKAGTIASGLVRGGIQKLGKVIFDGKKKGKGGNDMSTQPSNDITFMYSSSKPYSKRFNLAKLTNDNPFERGDLSEHFLRFNLAQINIDAASTSVDEVDGDVDPTGVPAVRQSMIDSNAKRTAAIKQAMESLQKTPSKYSDRQRIGLTSRNTFRGLGDRIDFFNATENIVYDGINAKEPTSEKLIDEYDFIALKFYSFAQNKTLQFRCTVSELTETFTPSWESNKFIGNPFPFYTYSGIERSLSFSFKVFSLSLKEHMHQWERIEHLASLTYPQGYKGNSNAVVPPIIGFTLGNMYKNKECFIESLSFNVDENSPWEIGLNEQLEGEIVPIFLGGYAYTTNEESGKAAPGFKLPMIVNVEMTLKFIEGKINTSQLLYAYAK